MGELASERFYISANMFRFVALLAFAAFASAKNVPLDQDFQVDVMGVTDPAEQLRMAIYAKEMGADLSSTAPNNVCNVCTGVVGVLKNHASKGGGAACGQACVKMGCEACHGVCSDICSEIIKGITDPKWICQKVRLCPKSFGFDDDFAVAEAKSLRGQE